MAYKLDTLCVQGGYRPGSGGERIPPISQSTTYYYANTQEMADLFDLKGDGYFYTRLANPTVAAFEGKVAATAAPSICSPSPCPKWASRPAFSTPTLPPKRSKS